MKIDNICFSATGRAEAVAKDLIARVGEEKSFTDLSDPDMAPARFSRQDVCLVTFSVFEGRVPAPAGENMKKLSGNGAAAFLLAVYGNRAVDDALLEACDLLTRQGFVVIGAAEAVAQHSIITRVARDRPDRADREEVRGFFADALGRLSKAGEEMGENFTPGKYMEGKKVSLPGNRPYVEMGGVPVRPAASSACISCGLCRKRCPAGAISPENPRVTDKTKCITCMRCVEICPKKARRINPVMMKVAGAVMKKALSGHNRNRYYPAE